MSSKTTGGVSKKTVEKQKTNVIEVSFHFLSDLSLSLVELLYTLNQPATTVDFQDKMSGLKNKKGVKQQQFIQHGFKNVQAKAPPRRVIRVS